MIVLAQGEKTGGNDYTLLRNCEWNEKQKHKKQPFSDASASHLSLVLRHV